MSFILDALKKSENERQRHNGPSMAEIPFGHRRSSQPWWLILIVILLLINLGVLMFWLWRKDVQPTAAATATPAPAAQPAPASAAPPAPVPAPAQRAPADVRPLSAEADADTALPAEAEEAEPAATDEPRLVRRVTQENSAATAAPPPRANTTSEGVPTLDALGGAGNLNLQPLHLDILVYSASRAERFAFINMHKYTEGQTLTEGPTVERIASDGVILAYHGQRFLLPR